MKFQLHQSLRGESGRKYRVDDLAGAGTQGSVYRATDADGRPCIVKAFRKRFQSKSLEQRLRRLLDLKLSTLCPTLIGPTDLIASSDAVGHVAPFAEGQPLELALGDGSILPQQALQIAVAVTHSIAVLEDNGLAHGDLQTGHVIVKANSDHHQVSMIDFDNFVADGIPEPDCVGASLFMAPELRTGKQRPDKLSDRFALAAVLHEVLLLRHVTSGFLPDDAKGDPKVIAEQFEKLMTGGRWLHDPAATTRMTSQPGGHSSALLNVELARLFRRGLSNNLAERPSPHEWRAVLLQAMYEVVVCPHCGYQNISDASKRRCPGCGRAYPVLALEGPFGRIVLNKASVIIGRDQIKDDTVSEKHAIIRRSGPDYWITDRSTNGISRRTPTGEWRPFTKLKAFLIKDGDRLKLGQAEVQVVTAG